eukprot:g8560.t1
MAGSQGLARWDKLAGLHPVQEQAIQALTELLPAVQEKKELHSTQAPEAAALAAGGVKTTQLLQAVLDCSAPPAAPVARAGYIGVLRRYAAWLHSALAACQASSQHWQEVEGHYDTVSNQTQQVRRECETLLQEQRALLEQSKRLQEDLEHFNQADKIQQQLRKGMRVTEQDNLRGSLSPVLVQEFCQLLENLSTSMDWMEAHSEFADAPKYLQTFNSLKSEVLETVRMHWKEALALTPQGALPHSSPSPATASLPDESFASSEALATRAANNTSTAGEGNEKSLLLSPGSIRTRTTELRSTALTLRPLLRAVETRAITHRDYSQLLQDLKALYYQHRHRVLYGWVQKHCLQHAESTALSALSRSMSGFMIEVCSQEVQLFNEFFLPPSAFLPQHVGEGGSSMAQDVDLSQGQDGDVTLARPFLDELLHSLTTLLYTTLRPRVIHETSLDVLCEVVTILKYEILEDQIALSGGSLRSVEEAVMRLLADIQERLAFLAQEYIRDEIHLYTSRPEDLDYPQRLLDRKKPSQPASPTSHTGGRSKRETSFATWHPVLERTLMFLSKLYRCVEVHVFQSLAQQVLFVCITALKTCSTHIGNKNPPANFHGPLFLVQHLLLLREQIAPFQVQFLAREHKLDFTPLTGGGFFSADSKDNVSAAAGGGGGGEGGGRGGGRGGGGRGRGTPLDWARVMRMVERVTPKIQIQEVDSRKHLEAELRRACVHLMKLQAAYILNTLTTKLTQLEKERPQSEQEAQAFLSLLSSLSGTGTQSAADKLKQVVELNTLYLANPVTERILLKPLQRQLNQCMERARAVLDQLFTPPAVAAELAKNLAQVLRGLEEDLERVVPPPPTTPNTHGPARLFP